MFRFNWQLWHLEQAFFLVSGVALCMNLNSRITVVHFKFARGVFLVSKGLACYSFLDWKAALKIACWKKIHTF